MQNPRRASLVCAIGMTIALLVAAVVPIPSTGVGSEGAILHWLAHLVAFAILAFTWRCGLPRVSALAVALAVVAFGFAHEAIEIFGHSHAYEWADAVVDGIGSISGVLIAFCSRQWWRDAEPNRGP
jgi:hypothetical protein